MYQRFDDNVADGHTLYLLCLSSPKQTRIRQFKNQKGSKHEKKNIDSSFLKLEHLSKIQM